MTSRVKFKISLLVILTALFLGTPKTAFADWIKYSGNPIFSGTPDGWDANHVANSCLIHENGIYKMWYAGFKESEPGWRIGYAISEDGKSNWQKRSEAVIKPSPVENWDEQEVAHPSVLHSKVKGYEMWYSATSARWAAGADRFRLRYASSSDGIVWNIYPNYILKGTSGAWDSGGISRGISVIHSDEGYKMWYTGVDNYNNWGIGYATSTDGIHWNKHPSPVIQPNEPWELNWLSYPNTSYDGQIYHMWYTATETNTAKSIIYATSIDGIHWNKPAGENPVITLGSSGSFDGVFIVSPFVIKEDNVYKMWYSGFDSDKWQIGYAENQITPSPPPLQPLIILPGLGGSWKHEAMILGMEKKAKDWYVTPGIKVYDGFIQTLQNAGYEPEINLFIFNYDWRKSIDIIAEEFKNYIETIVNPPPETKIDLIGHSLGGMVARTYIQNNPENHQVDQLITLGSPHQGVPKVYYLWEGADLNKTLSGWQRVGAGLLLHLNKPTFSTKVATIQAIIPSLKDLLPIFSYLKTNGIKKPIDEMVERNEWLAGLNFAPPHQLLNSLNTFAGISFDTLRWIGVGEPNWLEQLMGFWKDGKPSGEEEFAPGDRTVLAESAQLAGANLITLENLDHSDLVEEIKGQQEIVNLLGLSPTEIIPAPEISYESILVFQLASPAILSVSDSNGNPVGFGDNKITVIPGAVAGEYQVKVTGIQKGEYHLYIGQIVNNKDVWTTTSGSINPDEKINYLISFNPSSPLDNPLIDKSGNDYKTSARVKLISLKNYIVASKNISQSIKRSSLSYLNYAIRYLDRGMIEKSIIYLYRLHYQIAYWESRGNLDESHAREIKNKIVDAISDLEFTYAIIKTGTYNQSYLDRELHLAESYFNRMETKLKDLANQGKAKPDYGAIYLLALEKLSQAQSSSSYEAHIKALGAKYLSQEGLRFFR